MDGLVQIANVLGPIATILVFISAAVGFPVAIWRFRKWLLEVLSKILGIAETAAERSTAAADNAVAAAGTTHELARSTVTASEQLDQTVVYLAEQVGRSLSVSERTFAAMDRMAGQNDTWFAAYTQLLAVMREQHGRITALEEDAAARETEEHVTGRFRLRDPFADETGD